MRHRGIDDWTRFLFSFQGRATRSDLWLRFALPAVVAYPLLGVLTTALSEMLGLRVVALFLYLAALVALLRSSGAMVTRRLHDRDLSGRYQFAPLGFLAVGGILVIADMVDRLDRGAIGPVDPSPNGVGLLLALGFGLLGFGAILAVWTAIQVGFLRGTPGPNRYGPDPLA